MTADQYFRALEKTQEARAVCRSPANLAFPAKTTPKAPETAKIIDFAAAKNRLR